MGMKPDLERMVELLSSPSQHWRRFERQARRFDEDEVFRGTVLETETAAYDAKLYAGRVGDGPQCFRLMVERKDTGDILVDATAAALKTLYETAVTKEFLDAGC